MKKVAAFVDGFNVYYSMQKSQANVLHKYKWLNLRKLLNKYIFPLTEELGAIYYFSALTNDNDKRGRHLAYINALRSEKISVIMGYLRYDPIECPSCKGTFMRPIEKQTDANIISQVMKMAILDEFDLALIVSADSDLVPMIKAIRQIKPSKEFRVVIPINQKAKELTQVCGDRRKVQDVHLADAQFPESVTLTDGTTVTRPVTWQ